MNKFTLLALILSGFLLSFSQVSNQSKIPLAQRKLDALKGTYELKYVSREMSSLPSNLADIIEKNRKENETATIPLNEKVELIIYPRNKTGNHIQPVK